MQKDKTKLHETVVGCLLCISMICFYAPLINDCRADDLPGSISGTVTGSVGFGGTPLSGVTVEVFDGNWNYVISGTTDGNGDYSITDLPAGWYYLHTSNTLGYVDKYYHEQTFIPIPTRQYASLVIVNSGVDTGSMNMELDDYAGSISGRVVDGVGGAGIEGVTIVVQGSSSVQNSNIITMVDTDASGYYTVPGLGSVIYLRTENSDGYADKFYDNVTSYLDASNIILTPYSTTVLNDLTLFMSGSVSGRVTRASDGAGIQDALIYLFEENNDYYTASTTTDSQGYYSIDNLEPDVYYINARHTDYVGEYYDDASPLGSTGMAVPSGGTLTDIDFELESGGSISGRVTRASDGTGIRSLRVTIVESNGSIYSSQRTNEQGYYQISGLPTGKYYVSVEGGRIYDYFTYQNIESGVAGEYYSGAARRGSATAVSVVRGQDTGSVDFELGNDATISGLITREGGLYPGVLEVYIYDSDWNQIDSRGISGAYNFTGLLPGSYYVYADTRYATDYANEYYGGSTNRSGAVAVTVAYDEDVTGIDIFLGEGGSISGTVISASGQSGIPEVSVEVFNSAWEPVNSAETDESGDYSVYGLAAGSYYVLAAASPYYIEEYYAGSVSPSGALPVAVVQGQDTADIDFELEASFGIYGTVTGFADEQAIEGVEVNVYNAGWALVDSGTTDAFGRYGIEGLAAGKYYVNTSNGQGYEDKYCCFTDTQGGASQVYLQYFSREVNFTLFEKAYSGRKDAVIDFGAGVGLWARYGDTTWKKLHNMSPELIAVGDLDGSGEDDCIIDFGTGVG
ncbi:MAG: carboxypeptidase regulatory-like domain-containing protein, partial [Acidobacteria bacterium]|nr:carboxypeptidase regulatory-like domain-containing protein [Acidobacteriota bacterium]